MNIGSRVLIVVLAWTPLIGVTVSCEKLLTR